MTLNEGIGRVIHVHVAGSANGVPLATIRAETTAPSDYGQTGAGLFIRL